MQSTFSIDPEETEVGSLGMAYGTFTVWPVNTRPVSCSRGSSQFCFLSFFFF